MIDEEGESFLLTGGWDSKEWAWSRVSRYDIRGWQEDLDDLNTGRYSHGCTSYTNNDGNKVRMVFVISNLVSSAVERNLNDLSASQKVLKCVKRFAM